MAASAWQLYDMSIEYLMDGTLDLDTTVFDLHLFISGNDAGTLTQSALSELSSQLASGSNYSQSGRQMVTTWVTGVSGRERRFDASDMILTASGGDWNLIRTAVIVARTGASGKDGANVLLCKADLSTASFSVTDGNTLTLTFPIGGVFELNQV